MKDIPLHPADPKDEIAFELLSNISRAWEHVRAETGIELQRVNVFYGDSFDTDEHGSYYLHDTIGDYLSIVPHPSLPTDYFPPLLIDFLEALPDQIGPIEKGLIRDVAGIHYDAGILNNSTRFYEVIYHEYGHHVMSKIFEAGPPFSVGPHKIDTEYNPEHAWVEGWAEFYSAAAREYWGIHDHLIFAGSANIENLGYEYNDSKAWESVEGNVAGILWDMHDTNNEANDNLSLSFGDMVRFIKSYDPNPGLFWPLGPDSPWNIRQIFEAYRQYYAPDPSIADLWQLFEESGIYIEDTTPPQNPTSYISSHNSTIPINNSLIRVDFSGAFDSLSGVKEYYYWMYYEPTIRHDPNDPDDLNYIENYWRSSRNPSFQWDTEFSDNEWYLYVITRDAAGNFANEIYRAGPFLVREMSTLQMEGIVSNAFGEIFANSFTQVTIDPLKYPGKEYQLATLRIFDNEPDGEPLEYSEPFYLSGKDDGSYKMEIFGVTGDESEQMYLVPLTIDNTPPSIGTEIGLPNYRDGLKTYVNRDTAFSINVADGGSGVRYVGYSLLESDWIPYTGPFALPALDDGIVVITALAEDNLGNNQNLELQVYLDNASPEIRPEIGMPKLESESLHVTRSTAFTADIQDFGSGFEAAQYTIFKDTESPEWKPYEGPFTLPDEDAVYNVSYRAADRLGNANMRTLIVVNDNTGPDMKWIFPPQETALQDVVNLRIVAKDISGVQSVTISIRNAENPYAPIGFEAMNAVFDSSEWSFGFDTLQLPDGNYVAIATATDGLGNQSEVTVACSIRNVALTAMLPAARVFNAGRTVPVKFSLKVKQSVDPMEPFVYNENMEVRIYKDGNLLQRSCFGNTSTDYRISIPDQLYITNFKTLKTKAEYTVMLFRGGFLVGSFTFETIN